jgi:hypothetical protein
MPAVTPSSRSLVIVDPEGWQRTVELAGTRVTVGRLREFNDIALEPDPQLLVSRQVHCLIERDGSGWWVVDNGSVNGTFLRAEPTQTLARVQGRAELSDSDRICILGMLTEEGEPRYWTLTFHDPQETKWVNVGALPRPVCLEYDWSQAVLYRVERGQKVEIRGLRPLEHKLVRYMAQRTRANGGVPVLCSYEELIEALWGEDATRTPDEVTHLVWGLRQKIEPDRAAPRLLETERGLGYRLRTCSPPD